MNTRSSPSQLMLNGLIVWALSALGALLGLLLATRDLETAGLGLLASLLLLPSAAGAVGLAWWERSLQARLLGYAVPWLGLLTWAGLGWWLDGRRATSDGSGDMAWYVGVTLLAGGVVGLLALWRLSRHATTAAPGA